MRALLQAAAFTLTIAGMPLLAAKAAVIGQIDTFQGGTLEGWFAGGGASGQVPPVLPQVIAAGGPAGAGDAYMLITSNGQPSSPGGRLVVQNQSQWSGDYLTAGVGGIGMDLRNFGGTDLAIRLELVRIPGDRVVTTAATILPAGGAWTHVDFGLSPADLTAFLGSATDALGGLDLLRIIHAPIAAMTGFTVAVPVVALLGIDNITALESDGGGVTPIPEPQTLLLLASALIGLTTAASWRRTQPASHARG